MLPERSIDPRRNWLLKQIPPEDFDSIARQIRPVKLARGQILCEQNDTIQYVYFPVTCVVSVAIAMRDGATTETATIGCEGVAGLDGLFSAGPSLSSAQFKVQIAGDALVGDIVPLRQAATSNPSFRITLERYLQAFLHQIIQSVGCNQLHTARSRLSRWLLMIHDRVGSDTFPMTHEMLADMLGVRRATVSVVANRLQDAGIIRYTHGSLTIVDRDELATNACECYDVVRAAYLRNIRSNPWPAVAKVLTR